MHAIAAAREGVEMRIREEGMSGPQGLPLLRVYASEQDIHRSIKESLRWPGSRSLRKIPVDAQFRMIPDALAEAIAEDKRNGTSRLHRSDGRHHFHVKHRSYSAIVEIGEAHAMWLHVDAAMEGRRRSS